MSLGSAVSSVGVCEGWLAGAGEWSETRTGRRAVGVGRYMCVVGRAGGGHAAWAASLGLFRR